MACPLSAWRQRPSVRRLSRRAFPLALGILLCAAQTGAASAFPNSEPDAAEQWYLVQDKAWDHWSAPPTLQTVKVAVIDSGIDYGHPDFAGQIAGGKSFVPGSSWKTDANGHGTFVAGLIAASPFNGIGIAGMAFNAKLLIAKVVQPNGDVSAAAEASAIDWAVREGARVINLSLGGIRDPEDAQIDSFSALERDAIEYAYSKGAVIVAAVGNSTQAAQTPWPFADYPAALPNVIGVAALQQDGSVPDWSNRDPRYVDIAAPGAGIFSTIPRNLVDPSQPSCAGQPYSNCGPSELSNAIGTSFAAPQVSAAAALLLGTDPALAPDQVIWLLERSAHDMNPSDGCLACRVGRDALTGWGRLDVAAALSDLENRIRLPPPDTYEPNDNAGSQAYLLSAPTTVTDSLDYWDDPIDVYALRLQAGQRLYARLTAAGKPRIVLELWGPGTTDLTAPAARPLARSTTVGAEQRLSFQAPATGTYDIAASVSSPTRERAVYRLAIGDAPAR
jgi:serine protease